MNIGQAAKGSGVSAKKIRYYESIGLVPRPPRTKGGYRDYDLRDVSRLIFICRARSVGVSFKQVRELLKLWSNVQRGVDVKALALTQIKKLEIRAAKINQMIKTLRNLANPDGRYEGPQTRFGKTRLATPHSPAASRAKRRPRH